VETLPCPAWPSSCFSSDQISAPATLKVARPRLSVDPRDPLFLCYGALICPAAGSRRRVELLVLRGLVDPFCMSSLPLGAMSVPSSTTPHGNSHARHQGNFLSQFPPPFGFSLVFFSLFPFSTSSLRRSIVLFLFRRVTGDCLPDLKLASAFLFSFSRAL